MWLGRLEIVPVVIIIMGLVKGIKEDVASSRAPSRFRNSNKDIREDGGIRFLPLLSKYQGTTNGFQVARILFLSLKGSRVEIPCLGNLTKLSTYP